MTGGLTRNHGSFALAFARAPSCDHAFTMQLMKLIVTFGWRVTPPWKPYLYIQSIPLSDGGLSIIIHRGAPYAPSTPMMGPRASNQRNPWCRIQYLTDVLATNR